MSRLGIVVMQFGGVLDLFAKKPTPEYNALLAIFSPLKTEENFVTGEVKMTGYCEAFENIPSGVQVPEYVIEFRQINNLILVSNITRQ
jgi:hypothetical protein